jgi:hypothetical protein
MELEAEVDRLQREIDRTRDEASAAVAANERKHRRDLVPLHQSVLLFREAKRIDPPE